MREILRTIKVYTFPELSERAQERVRDWWNRVQWEDGAAQESMQLLADGFLEERGWEDVRDLTYSLYSQGGEPRWAGVLPEFTHDGRTYVATFTLRPLGGSSYAWNVALEDTDGTDSDTYYGTPEWRAYLTRIEAAEEAAKDRARADASALLQAMCDEDDYMSSAEQVAEVCEANGYEFTEDGDLI